MGIKMRLNKKIILRLIVINISLILALLFAANTSFANPDMATFKSAVVWRQDNLGDYVFSKFDAPGIYETGYAHTTEGEITSITASWQFTGEVTLEVSADNGKTYAPIVNGVPLTSGFGKGSSLKWRVTLGVDSDLTQVKIAYRDTSGVVGTFGDPRLSGFNRRKKLSILNPSDEHVFNCQLRLLIAENIGPENYDIHLSGDIEADFKDIRFTSADGQNILPHYLEGVDDTSSNRVAVVWVKVAHIPPKGVDFYIYYGNVLAADTSAAEAVFDLYDDFEEDRLDEDKWEIQEGAYLVSDSQLQLSAAEVLTKEFKMRDGIVEYRATSKSGEEVWVILRGQTVSVDTANQTAYSSAYKGAEHCLAIGDFVKANEPNAISAGITYDYLAVLKGTALRFQRYTKDFSALEAEVTFDDVGGLTSGKIGLKSGEGCITHFDWIRVRKVNTSGLELDKKAAESAISEYVAMPSFDGIGITGSDNLTLQGELEQGTYISQELSLSETARVVTPYWNALDAEKGQVLLDISLDGGINYLERCLEDNAYYASKGEFYPGDELRLKVTLLRLGYSIPQLEEISIEYGPGKILVATPNGGELWKPGMQEAITWTAQEYELTYPMKIEYSLDSGQSYILIADKVENTGSYIWSVPKDVYSEKALVKVSDALVATVFDISDGAFTIGKEKAIVKEKEVPLAQEEEAPEVVAQVEEEAPEAEEVAAEEKAPKLEEDLDELLEKEKRPGTKMYDVLVKLHDNHNPDPAVEALCYKHGDVVLVRPAGFDWSETERNSFLIVQLNLTPEEAGQLTKVKQEITTDEAGQLEERVLQKREKRINLAKLGLSRSELDMDRRKEKLHRLRSHIKGKALKTEALIEER